VLLSVAVIHKRRLSRWCAEDLSGDIANPHRSLPFASTL
jgi:hypothetical protein